jgi:hypothetical protein
MIDRVTGGQLVSSLALVLDTSATSTLVIPLNQSLEFFQNIYVSDWILNNALPTSRHVLLESIDTKVIVIGQQFLDDADLLCLFYQSRTEGLVLWRSISADYKSSTEVHCHLPQHFYQENAFTIILHLSLDEERTFEQMVEANATPAMSY